ncbi:MAG: 3-isopropylmalate dehydrogenase [Candidatus Zixiibacteriota bacterium]|nr:MAG: 3-isopropylmalate dehydrogenase [candidate division Zixibacteria bacterium]
MRRIAVIPGDGIGPEVIREAVKVLQAVTDRSGLEIQVTQFEYDAKMYLAKGAILPDEQVEDFRRNFDALLLGALGDPRVPQMRHVRDFYVKLCAGLDLFLCYHLVKLHDARYCPLKDKKPADVNFTLFSEYGPDPHSVFGGAYRKGQPEEVVFRQHFISRGSLERLLGYAFEYARKRGLKCLTLSCNGHELAPADDLWERVFAEVAREYPELETEVMSVSQTATHLLRSPERFHVIVTSSQYGDVLADLGAQLQGGLGLAAAGYLNPGRVSLFTPAHGPLNHKAGQNIVNPLGAISSVALVLEHLGFHQEAGWVNGAVKYALQTANVTHDLGGRLSTRQVGDFIIHQIRKGTC